jgi:hypothetical protein
VDVRLAAFVMAVLLLAGTIEATRDWLIGLTIVTGVAMVAPKLISIDLFGEGDRDWDRSWRWSARPYWPDRWERRRRRPSDWGREAQRDFDNWGSPRSATRYDDRSEV